MALLFNNTTAVELWQYSGDLLTNAEPVEALETSLFSPNRAAVTLKPNLP